MPLSSRVLAFFLATGAVLSLSSGLHAHGGVHPAPQTPSEAQAREEHVKLIAANYDKNVRPIFEKSCFDCHSDKTRYPSYYKYPIAKQLIDHDINDGRKHLDMSNGYPFKSHATPVEDLKAIEGEVREGDMPPWRYYLIHSDAKLTPQEKQTIFDWVKESLALLEAK